MRLDDMRVFATVVEEGGFTAAGRALGLPKSSVSRRVQGLEEFLGVRLLQRTTRSLRLTEAGERYYADCAQIMEAAGRANRAAATAQSEPRGTLRLTAPPTLGEAFLGPIINTYLARWPAARVELDLSTERRDLIAEGYDLAIRVGYLEDSTLVARRLGEATGLLCASTEYAARRGLPDHPSELSAHDVVEFGFPGFAAQGRWRFTRPAPGGGEDAVSVPIEPRFRANSIPLLMDAIREGVGIGWLPQLSARDELSQGRLVQVLEGWPVPSVPVHAVYPSRENMAAKVRAFIELVWARQESHTPWLLNQEQRGEA